MIETDVQFWPVMKPDEIKRLDAEPGSKRRHCECGCMKFAYLEREGVRFLWCLNCKTEVSL